MSSVRVIAREAGVSIATVSRVLNNHPRVSQGVRDKVLAAANEKRYVAQVSKRSTANVARSIPVSCRWARPLTPS